MSDKQCDKHNERNNHESIFEELIGNPLWQVERDFWERLKKDFPQQIASINKCLRVLRIVDNKIYDQILNEDLDINKVAKEIKNERGIVTRADVFPFLLNNSDDFNIGVCHEIFSEALNRLISGRLLLFTGHLSRVYSCIRDMYECLRT
ncbi:MAG: hypothetical protein PHU52_04935, partial [Dehalococcoidales bacterium]|nr:hypothetical protein [Dehalococcoidales bacterium]